MKLIGTKYEIAMILGKLSYIQFDVYSYEEYMEKYIDKRNIDNYPIESGYYGIYNGVPLNVEIIEDSESINENNDFNANERVCR